VRLQEALEQFGHDSRDLSDRERKFLTASADLRHRTLRGRMLLAIASTATAVIIALVLGLGTRRVEEPHTTYSGAVDAGGLNTTGTEVYWENRDVSLALSTEATRIFVPPPFGAGVGFVLNASGKICELAAPDANALDPSCQGDVRNRSARLGWPADQPLDIRFSRPTLVEVTESGGAAASIRELDTAEGDGRYRWRELALAPCRGAPLGLRAPKECPQSVHPLTPSRLSVLVDNPPDTQVHIDGLLVSDPADVRRTVVSAQSSASHQGLALNLLYDRKDTPFTSRFAFERVMLDRAAGKVRIGAWEDNVDRNRLLNLAAVPEQSAVFEHLPNDRITITVEKATVVATGAPSRDLTDLRPSILGTWPQPIPTLLAAMGPAVLLVGVIGSRLRFPRLPHIVSLRRKS
jgi:hypothetical protein